MLASKLDPRGRANVYQTQVRSIMEYSCLAGISASLTTLRQLEVIQKKALKSTGVDEDCALKGYALTSLSHNTEQLLQQPCFSRCTLPTVRQT